MIANPDAVPIFPKQLRDIARYCDAIEAAEGQTGPPDGGGINLANDIPVMDCESDFVFGHLRSEGVGWAFYPAAAPR